MLRRARTSLLLPALALLLSPALGLLRSDAPAPGPAGAPSLSEVVAIDPPVTWATPDPGQAVAGERSALAPGQRATPPPVAVPPVGAPAVGNLPAGALPSGTLPSGTLPSGTLPSGPKALGAPSPEVASAPAAPLPSDTAGSPAVDGPADPTAVAVPVGDRLAAFRGLGTWIDLYDRSLEPEHQVVLAAAGGVQTIFAQASFTRTAGVAEPDRLARLIETAHDHGMQVMVWTLPSLVSVHDDHVRAHQAATFTTPRGDRPDALGIDIEVTTVADHAERNRRLVELLTVVRQTLPDVPLAAIPYPPLQLELNQQLWPAFPWAEVAAQVDVVIPMSYSSFRGTGWDVTKVWNRDNVVRLRQLAGDAAVPVHLAGGIANDLPHPDAFTEAVLEAGAIGGSLYDLHTTPAEVWPHLAPLRDLVGLGSPATR